MDEVLEVISSLSRVLCALFLAMDDRFGVFFFLDDASTGADVTRTFLYLFGVDFLLVLVLASDIFSSFTFL